MAGPKSLRHRCYRLRTGHHLAAEMNQRIRFARRAGSLFRSRFDGGGLKPFFSEDEMFVGILPRHVFFLHQAIQPAKVRAASWPSCHLRVIAWAICSTSTVSNGFFKMSRLSLCPTRRIISCHE